MMKWKKGMAALMAGIMSFGVLSTTLAVPAEAASHHYEDSKRGCSGHNRVDGGGRCALLAVAAHGLCHECGGACRHGHGCGIVEPRGAVVGAVIAKNT